jgi:hypothetical protein
MAELGKKFGRPILQPIRVLCLSTQVVEKLKKKDSNPGCPRNRHETLFEK